MKIMTKKYSILFFILVFGLWGSFASAQVRETDIVLSISPQYPGSNQNVSAALNSYVINLDKANISWSVNGQEMATGVGKKSFFFKTGNVGSPVLLSAAIETIDKQNLSKMMTIAPADADVLWEAYDSYTPPFYKGKTLVPSQGTFKVVAIPNLVTANGKVNINNLSYVWAQDGKTKLDSSGWGKNYFIFQNSYLDRGNTVNVKISDISGSINTSGKIVLNTGSPKILFYRNDPTLGVKWDEVLSDGFKINPNGESIIVEPYFFSPKDISSPDLTFNWSLNGQKIQTPDPKNILSIKPEAGKSGTTIIGIAINNISTLFQSLSKQISVSF